MYANSRSAVYIVDCFMYGVGSGPDRVRTYTSNATNGAMLVCTAGGVVIKCVSSAVNAVKERMRSGVGRTS